MKHVKSKLDAHADKLTEWFLGGKTLIEAQRELAECGCSVSLGRLSGWWSDRQRHTAEERLLSDVATGRKFTQELEARMEKDAPPAIQTLMALLRVLILKLSAHGAMNPETLDMVVDLTRPVLEWERLQSGKEAILQANQKLAQTKEEFEFSKARWADEFKLAQEKHRRDTCELFLSWSEDQRAREIASSPSSNAAKIEQLGQLMFGESWK